MGVPVSNIHSLNRLDDGGIAGMLRQVARAIDEHKIATPVEAVVVCLNEDGKVVSYGLGEKPDIFRSLSILQLGKLALELEYFTELKPPPMRPAG